ncbi:MAG: bifunctional riboflavin kinase/FAD synthetase [Deltaproteobacteria bacterium]|nr:bifunctional riboflavin kinase/FAD synthetase [Deltaproteobacteria bacterium]
MLVLHGFQEAKGKLPGCAVALGNFDGVHLGHQALFSTALDRARARGAAAVAATFEPHPGKVLFPDLAPKLLIPLPRKLELLEALGLDAVILQPFDRAYASLTAQAFLDDELFAGLAPLDVVVGPDFTFGRARSGTGTDLRHACQMRGVGFHEQPAVTCDGGGVVSSTKIREFIAEGRVAAAALLLGRPFDLIGTVTRGLGRGRTLGFPTANLHPENEVRPGLGVYAVRAFVGDRFWGGAANIGRKPTFGEDEVTVEAHLFDFSQDLYGARMGVEFLERLRGEQRFGSVDELGRAIARDCHQARAIIGKAPAPGRLSPFAKERAMRS